MSRPIALGYPVPMALGHPAFPRASHGGRSKSLSLARSAGEGREGAGVMPETPRWYWFYKAYARKPNTDKDFRLFSEQVKTAFRRLMFVTQHDQETDK